MPLSKGLPQRASVFEGDAQISPRKKLWPSGCNAKRQKPCAKQVRGPHRTLTCLWKCAGLFFLSFSTWKFVLKKEWMLLCFPILIFIHMAGLEINVTLPPMPWRMVVQHRSQKRVILFRQVTWAKSGACGQTLHNHLRPVTASSSDLLASTLQTLDMNFARNPSDFASHPSWKWKALGPRLCEPVLKQSLCKVLAAVQVKESNPSFSHLIPRQNMNVISTLLPTQSWPGLTFHLHLVCHEALARHS